MDDALERTELHHLEVGDGPGPRPRLAVYLTEPESSGPGTPAMLYLHGFASRQAGEKAAFFRQRAAAAGLAFCSFDFRGHGESEGGMLELTLTRNLEDVARAREFLAERGFGPVAIFGSSMGGGTALWYAAQNPDEVAAIVALAPSIELAEGLLRRVGEEAARMWESEGRFELEHELGTQEVGWGLIEDLRTYGPERLKELYCTPALIFQGRHDTSVSWRAVLDFAVGAEFEEIELHLFAAGDHRLIDRLESLWGQTRVFLQARGILG